MKRFITTNQRGHLHLLAPLIAIIAVMGIGGLVALRLTSAATPSCGSTVIQPKSSGPCTQDAQQMLNGSLAYGYVQHDSAKTINNWSLSYLNSPTTFDVNNGFSKLFTPYGTTDMDWVSQFQGANHVPLTRIVDAATWRALCTVTNQIASSGAANLNQTTDYVQQNGKPTTTKQRLWYVRSYMRTGVTAASAADCAAILNPPTPTPTPTPTPKPTTTLTMKSVKSVATTTAVTISWTTTLPATGTVTYHLATATATKSVKGSTGQSHSFTITGLTKATKYDYQVTSTAGGKTVNLSSSFTTLAATTVGTGGGGGTGTGGGAFNKCVSGNGSITGLGGGQYNLNGNEWNSSATDVICNNGAVAFQITNSAIAPSNYLPSMGDPYGPGSYPDLYYGCNGSGGDCTTNSLPLKVSAMTTGTVTSDYDTTIVNSGSWDDSYDIWFNPPGAGGLGDLEMMIWLDESGASPAGSNTGRTINVGGNTYDVWYGNGGGTVSYVMANNNKTQTNQSVNNLDIDQFTADAVAHSYGKDGGISNGQNGTPDWSLMNIQAGFEDFNGNVDGLTANNFNVTVK